MNLRRPDLAAWMWRALAFLALAVLGAVVAIAASGKGPGPVATTTTTGSIATSSASATTVAPTTTVAPPPPPPTTTTQPPPPPPPHPTGWVVVLQSLPADARSSAEHTAATARAAALLHIGVLVSSDYRTLRPGYLVVYQGPFANEVDAQGAIRFVRAAGFRSAYVRQIAR